ncbi:MAG TPA: type II secretion system protein [Acidimicrobiales bacterium]|nr:type II secretion system protein [Acidimicrobiales bacterium]
MSSARPDRRTGAGGFTLVELLIVLTITPVIVGALSLGLITVFSLQNGVSNRISDSGDAQVTSATFLRDVQSAQQITTNQSTIACASPSTSGSNPTQLLGLRWGANNGQYAETVSYITDQNGGLSTYSLVRQLCIGTATSSATQVTTVASDLSEQGALTSPTVKCYTGGCGYATGWISAGNVQFVQLSVQEHALLPKPNQTTPFVLTLSASPRVHVEPGSLPPGGPFPITVLGTSCSTPSLEITNNVAVSINVAGQTGNGTLGLNAKKCPTVQVDNGGSLAAGAVWTTNASLNSVYNYPSGTTYPVPEFYTPTIVDPFANLPAPNTLAVPPTGPPLQPGVCAKSNGAWNCSAGYYTYDPGQTGTCGGPACFGGGAGQTINFTNLNCTADPIYQAKYGLSACDYLFEAGLSLPGQSTIIFGAGVYVYQGGTGNAITANPGVTINAASTGSSQVLFYIQNGTAAFSPGITINMAGYSQLLGVTIWDADISNPLVIGNNSNGGTSPTGYGGIYVPHEGVQVNNDKGGTLSVSFLVCNWISFGQNLTININDPFT